MPDQQPPATAQEIPTLHGHIVLCGLGTAGVHVGHVLNKLGFHARTEIASWAVQHGFGGTSEAAR